eukprot:2511615-Prymnesium_polylepis.1
MPEEHRPAPTDAHRACDRADKHSRVLGSSRGLAGLQDLGYWSRGGGHANGSPGLSCGGCTSSACGVHGCPLSRADDVSFTNAVVRAPVEPHRLIQAPRSRNRPDIEYQ